MLIIIKPKLDRQQKPYWTAMLMHEGNCLLEVTAPSTFPIGEGDFQLTKDFRETYENVAVRMMTELLKQPDQKSLRQMFLQEEIRPKNHPANN